MADRAYTLPPNFGEMLLKRFNIAFERNMRDRLREALLARNSSDPAVRDQNRAYARHAIWWLRFLRRRDER